MPSPRHRPATAPPASRADPSTHALASLAPERAGSWLQARGRAVTPQMRRGDPPHQRLHQPRGTRPGQFRPLDAR
eukprot:2550080-Prymnesium_polylepis.1